jgi:hypothetical protein
LLSISGNMISIAFNTTGDTLEAFTIDFLSILIIEIYLNYHNDIVI